MAGLAAYKYNLLTCFTKRCVEGELSPAHLYVFRILLWVVSR